jgi:hypothetical protein
LADEVKETRTRFRVGIGLPQFPPMSVAFAMCLLRQIVPVMGFYRSS